MFLRPLFGTAVGVDDYKRLLEEYQKVKGQNVVLKKAVLQEQQKTQQLEATVKERDIRLRATMEENDILSFNNQRLTKRVEVLQSSIEEERTRAASGGWFGAGAKQELQKTKEAMAVLQEELDTKIKETEQLHIRMFEERKDHKTLVETLSDKLEKLKVQLKKKLDEYEDLSSEHKHLVGKLTNEKTELIQRVEELSETLQRTKNLMQQREHAMTQLQQKLTSELDAAQTVLSQKVPFDDTRQPSLNQRNIPTFDRPMQQKRDSMFASMVGPTCKKMAEVFREMLDSEREKALLQNTNRALELPEAIRNCNRKLISSLSDVVQASATLADSVSRSSPATSQYLDQFVLLFGKLRSYRVLKLQLEVQHKQRIAENKALQDLLSQNEEKLFTAVSKFAGYMQLLIRGNGTSETAPAKSNFLFIHRKALGSIIGIRDVLRERSSALSSRVTQEHQSDPFLQPEIKLLNEKSIVSLSSLVALFEKLAAVMDQWVGMNSAHPRYSVHGARTSFPNGVFPLLPRVNQIHRFLDQVNNSADFEAPSVSYSDQLYHIKLLEQLKGDIRQKDDERAQLADQVARLEAERDRLLAEISGNRDQIASKQSSITELLAELADTRQKLSQFSTLYQRSATRTKELERERDNLLLRAAQQPHTPQIASQPDLLMTDESTAPATAPSDNQTLMSFDETSVPTQTHVDESHSASAQQVDLLGWAAPTPSEPAPSTGSSEQALLLDEIIPTLPSDLPPVVDVEPPAGLSSSGPLGEHKWRMVVMDEAGKQMDSLGFSLEDKERELQVKRYYEEKFANMRAQVEATDKRALDLLDRSRTLESRLAEALKQRDALESQISTAASSVDRSKEELETTRDNYESQLKLLTEHLVGLNDKIGGYEEELSSLKNCKVRCGKCTTWNTIGWLMTEGKMGQRCSKGNHPSSFNYA